MKKLPILPIAALSVGVLAISKSAIKNESLGEKKINFDSRFDFSKPTKVNEMIDFCEHSIESLLDLATNNQKPSPSNILIDHIERLTEYQARKLSIVVCLGYILGYTFFSHDTKPSHSQSAFHDALHDNTLKLKKAGLLKCLV